MKSVFFAGRKLVPGLVLLLMSGVLMAESTVPASYVKPGIDLSKYSRVLIKPLNLDNIEVMKPPWEQDDEEEWTFEPGSGQAVQKMFMDAMHKEVEGNCGYPIVTEAGDDVLRIEVELLSITPYVKPGARSADDPDYEISTLGSGDVVISAEFRDSSTRELLILVEGERTIGDEYKQLSKENHIANLNKLFSKWGVKIREALDADRGK